MRKSSYWLIFVFSFVICVSVLGQADAADVWVYTSYSGGDKEDWYVQTHLIKEDVSTREFKVPLKLVINGRLGNNRLHAFRLLGGDHYTWYCRQANSSREFTLVNGNELYERMFDACIPYASLAKKFPR